MSSGNRPGGGASAGIPPWADLILIGKITRTQGHRGSVRMLPEFEPLDRIEGLKSDELILKLPAPALGTPGRSQAPFVVHIENFSFHQRFVILNLAEIEDMNAAERIQGAEVYVRPDMIWDLAEGEFFAHEVIGFAVIDEETGRRLGKIRTVQSGAAHDFLIVKRESGKGEFPVPMVKEMVRKVDKETGRILVSLPEGLEEL